jgi:hypothetical protein
VSSDPEQSMQQVSAEGIQQILAELQKLNRPDKSALFGKVTPPSSRFLSFAVRQPPAGRRRYSPC